jgi:serine/threonine protein kinase
MGRTLAARDPAELVAPEVARLFLPDDPLPLDALLKGFVEARNERIGHRTGIHVPPRADAEALLEETRTPFRALCAKLRVLRARPLLYLHARSRDVENRFEFYRFVGMTPQQVPPLGTESDLRLPDRVPFLLSSRGDVLCLSPWVVVDQDASSARYAARVWEGWTGSGLVYSDPDGRNEARPASIKGLPLHKLAGRPTAAACKPGDLLAVKGRHLRFDACLPAEIGDALSATEGAVEVDAFPADYKPKHLLGRGATGAVYAAEQKDANRGVREVAVKVMHPPIMRESSFRERFAREVQVLRRLQQKHPGIVPVLDAGDEPLPYIAMEYIRGGDLGSLCLCGAASFDAQAAARVCEALLELLQVAHEAGVVHRDIKPSNVVLNDHGHPFLVDWGIAAVDWQDARRLTRTAEALGTWAFSAPEQLQPGGTPPDARADLYSMGRLFEFLLTKRTAPPDEVVPGLPPGVEAVVRRAVHADPRLRFTSAREMLDTVRERGTAGWRHGAPVQVGDRILGTYDLIALDTEAKGLYAFRAQETLTDGIVSIGLARSESEAADELLRLGRENARTGRPRLLRFSDMVCALFENEDAARRVAEAFSDDPKARHVGTALGVAALGSAGTVVERAASTVFGVSGGSAATVGSLNFVPGTFVRGLLAGFFQFGPALEDAVRDAFRRARRSMKEPTKLEVLRLTETARRLTLLVVLQLEADRGVLPTPTEWIKQTSQLSIRMAGLRLCDTLDAHPYALTETTFDRSRFAKCLDAVARWQARIAHGAPEGSFDTIASRERLADMLAVLDRLARAVPKRAIAPYVDTAEDRLWLLAGVGGRSVYLALDDQNSIKPFKGEP